MIGPLDWRILEALDDPAWLASFHSRLAGWPSGSTCWEWQGARDERGFGRLRLPAAQEGKTVTPHRVCWLEKYGAVHPGMVLQQNPASKCAGRWCANDACWIEASPGQLAWWVRKGLSHPSEVTTWNGLGKHHIPAGGSA